MGRSRRAESLLKLKPDERSVELKRLSPRQRRSMKRHWHLWAHEGQIPPERGWHSWLIMAGRGYGKTRAGAEWVREIAEADPTARIALIGASLGEARRVMVEGPSGLLAIAPPRNRPTFEPSKRQITWPNGAVATLYSAAEPESLRGPQHSHASGADAKRVHRQRGPCAARHATASRSRRRSLCTTRRIR
jgi:phage terminase large subunit-like protein